MKRFDLERDILRLVRDYLRWRGWFIVRNHQSLGSQPGVADLTGVKNGQTVWIEIKTSRGNLSGAQMKFKEQIEMHGGTFWVIRSLEELTAKISEKAK